MDTNQHNQTSTTIADNCDPLRTKSGQDESDLHPAMRSLQDWYLQQHPEDQHGMDPLMDRMNSALYGLDRTLGRTTPPAERPAYCCGKCGRQAHELENGNWLSRINPGEVPSRWRCQAHIETGPPVSTAPAERPTQDSNEAWGRFVGKGDATMLYHRMRNLERQRNEAREQRDRLADALEAIRQQIRSCAFDSLVVDRVSIITETALAAVKETTNAGAVAPPPQRPASGKDVPGG